ncbi:hypothetical protein B0H11DRAFT_857530 [Mycena galericulata]|nr:hypothetical protein B0H11DRAFT_857530 [Mycena galericulata]
MWPSVGLVTLGVLSSLNQHFVQSVDPDPIATRIIRQALEDGIDLAQFNFTAPALQEIVAWAHFDAEKSVPVGLLHPAGNATTVDVHAHHVPNWLRTIEPSDGGLPTPVWTLELQLQHMANQSIGRSILSIPKPNIFLGDKNATMAIAWLLNENSAALVKALPHRFSFFATSTLPYVDESITEVQYAVETLEAVGVALTSNHEGKYLGNPEFIPFFAKMETMNAIIFVHPANPLLETAGTFVLANPTVYPQGIAEFLYGNMQTRGWRESTSHRRPLIPRTLAFFESVTRSHFLIFLACLSVSAYRPHRALSNPTSPIQEGIHPDTW